MKDKFVRHERALLATGSSARSLREQLFLNGGFFLSENGYADFKDHMPELIWFQTQREGLGNELDVHISTDSQVRRGCTMGVRRDQFKRSAYAEPVVPDQGDVYRYTEVVRVDT
jgi:hypothetical protein